jgi:integrase
MFADRKYQALSAAKVRAISEPGLYADGNGLNLKVEPSGAKRWVQRVTIKGKRHNLGLGGYPVVSLAEAREMADDNQRAIRQGRNPIAEKRRAEQERRQQSLPTFAQAARQVIEIRRPTWSNEKHAAQWANTLATYVYPVIGFLPVNEINSADVLTVLTPIWTEKRETASRVRQRIETVFDWVVAQGWRSDNPAGKAVLRALPRHSRVKNHFEALNYSKVPEAVARVRECNADLVTRLSFEFLVLTATRSGEVRLASWSEIDEESRTWTIPAERMKARREHRVPLSSRARGILLEVKELEGQEGGLIFPGGRQGRPLSNMTHLLVLRRLEIPAVPHGFRSSFRDWVIEQTNVPWAVGEAALAHNLGNSTETAYARSDLFDRRRELMEAWSTFVVG